MARDPSDVYTPEPSLVERRAADLLGRYGGRYGDRRAEADGAPALRRAIRWAVGLAIVAGIVSGGLIGGSEIWARRAFGLEEREFMDALPYWIGWFAFAGVISAIEILFLYWVVLRGIGQVVAVARVELGEAGYPGLFARSFARGALEFPNPRAEIYGIDPYAYVPRWQLVLRAAAYKAKVGVSSFILRVLLRRVAARLAVRGLVPLIAGPLYAAWNAYIVWRIMTEARIRAFGPAAVDRMLETCFGEDGFGDDAAELALHGIGEITRRAGDLHPNYVYLVARLRERLRMDGDEVAVDWEAHRDGLRSLDAGERRKVLRLLALAAVVGSRTRRRQKALLEECCKLAGEPEIDDALKRLRRRLKDGRLSAPSDFAEAMAQARQAA